MEKGIKNLMGKGKSKTHEVRFNLKSVSDKNKSTLISAVFRYDGQKLVYSTQHKIAPKYWNARTQKPIASYPLYNDVNNDLKAISDAILKVYSQRKDETLPLDKFKIELDVILNRVEVVQEQPTIDFTSFLQSYINSLITGNDKKKRTAQKFKTLLINLHKFRPGKISFESIDVKFKDDFKKWRFAETKASSQNTINKDFECINTVLKKAFKNKLHNNDIFNDDEFSEKRVKTSIFALNESEVNRLYEFDLSDNPRLERVRDWFLISCWSALRWSDFSVLTPEHIIQVDKSHYLNKFNEKTGKEVYIPIDHRLYQILAKYNFRSISISNQKFNNYLKEVFLIAGFTDSVVVRQSVKGEMKDILCKKCDIVSAHDGRRTWATINYLKGYPIGLLMQVTGHSSEDTFLSYVGASSLDKAKRLNELMNNNK